jgi:methylamine---glutamate N-methyltransferase subunit C
MKKYRCSACKSYEYDYDRGDANTHTLPGVKPINFPKEWNCPVCRTGAKALVLQFN